MLNRLECDFAYEWDQSIGKWMYEWGQNFWNQLEWRKIDSQSMFRRFFSEILISLRLDLTSFCIKSIIILNFLIVLDLISESKIFRD